MDFFGLTSYGFSSPIKDMVRDDYKEPEKPSADIDSNKSDTRSFSEKIKELDCYLGCADGWEKKIKSINQPCIAPFLL